MLSNESNGRCPRYKGGYNTTSSLGCQTLYPDQWQGFQKLLYAEMDRAKVTKLPYLLIENKCDIS